MSCGTDTQWESLAWGSGSLPRTGEEILSVFKDEERREGKKKFNEEDSRLSDTLHGKEFQGENP